MSIRDIEKKLGIPRSTLSGWFKNVPLSIHHTKKLQQRQKQNLIYARTKAVMWHNQQKQNRLRTAQEYARRTLSNIDCADKNILELSLAILYLGEGTKRRDITSMGNSDPRILRFFIHALRTVYGVPTDAFRCELHLRDDQNVAATTNYWSKELSMPVSSFGKPSVDARARGKATFERYRGVCVVRCGRVEIQRRLMYIANGFCDKIIDSAVMRG